MVSIILHGIRRKTLNLTLRRPPPSAATETTASVRHRRPRPVRLRRPHTSSPMSPTDADKAAKELQDAADKAKDEAAAKAVLPSHGDAGSWPGS